MKGIKAHFLIIVSVLFIIVALLSDAYGTQEKMTPISGKVVYKGKPVPKAEVYLTLTCELPQDSHKHEIAAKTGADGKFAVKNLTPGSRMTVEIQADGYARGSWNMIKAGQ